MVSGNDTCHLKKFSLALDISMNPLKIPKKDYLFLHKKTQNLRNTLPKNI